MNQIKYGILHWGPCVVKTKADPETLDLLLSEGELSKEDASPELAGVLKNQFHYRDKKKFSKFMEGVFNLYNHICYINIYYIIEYLHAHYTLAHFEGQRGVDNVYLHM